MSNIANGLKMFKLKVLRQLALYKQEPNTLSKFMNIVIYHYVLFLLSIIVPFIVSRNPLKYACLITWPFLVLTGIVISFVIMLGCIVYVTIKKGLQASIRAFEYTCQYGLGSFLLRIFVAIITLGTISFIGTLWGLMATIVIFLFDKEGGFGLLFEYMMLFFSVFFSMLVFSAFKGIRKELSSLRDFLIKFEEEVSEPEPAKTMNENSSMKFLRWWDKFVKNPYNFMWLCFTLAVSVYNFLLHGLTVLLLRFPGIFLTAPWEVNKSAVYKISINFLITQTFEVIPFSVFESFLSLDLGLEVVKPWGTIMQIIVQAVILVNLLIIVVAGTFYVNYWRYRRGKGKADSQP